MKKSNNEVRIVPPVLRGVEAGSELFCELLVNDDEVDCRSFSREVVDGVDLSEVNVSSCVFDHVSFPDSRMCCLRIVICRTWTYRGACCSGWNSVHAS